MTENPPRSMTPFVFGIVIGAVAGLLLAPKAGRETRKDVQSWLKQSREKSRLVAHHNGHRRAAHV